MNERIDSSYVYRARSSADCVELYLSPRADDPDSIEHSPFVRLYVDVDDNRGKHVIRKKGSTQRAITGLWRKAYELLAADTLLDIGANYGEIGLGCRYDAGSRVFLFEPNPTLHPFLARSIASHTNRERIELIGAAVGEKGGKVKINYDRKWSGTSSIARLPKDREYKGEGTFAVETAMTELVGIDEFLAEENIAPRTLLFKVDVEGYEFPALSGMRKTLSACEFFSIVEVTSLPRTRKQFIEPLRQIDGLGSFYRIGDASVIDLFGDDDPAGDLGRDVIYTNIDPAQWRAALIG